MFNAGHWKRDGREYAPLEFVEQRDVTVRCRVAAGEAAA